jgi:hypothetical protein
VSVLDRAGIVWSSRYQFAIESLHRLAVVWNLDFATSL